MRNIIIGLTDPQKGQIIKETVVKSGFLDTEICTSGDEVLRMCGNYDEGIVVCGYKVGNTIYSDIYEMLPQGYGMLVLLSSKQASIIDNQEIFSLVMPVNKSDIIKTINMIFEIGIKPLLCGKKNIEEIKQGTRSDNEKLLIEHAKIFLMNKYKISEVQAHKFMQKSSMNKGLKMIEVAKIILKDD